MLTILQASDLHFGTAYDPVAGRAFADAVDALSPDLVVIAGDVTQRAKVREYREARAYLSRLTEVPQVVTPGNHDVPLYRAHERLLAPFRNYRAYMERDLDTVTRVPGAVVVALNTAAPRRRIVNGCLRGRQLAFAARIFQEGDPRDTRIVVAHHPLASAPDEEPSSPLPGAPRILDALRDMGAELVLGGHFHRGFVVRSSEVHAGHDAGDDLVLAYSGTATSTRGRAGELGENSFHLIGLEGDSIRVEHRQLNREAMTFEPVRERTLPRRPTAPDPAPRREAGRP